jgi:hypothetical protein
MGGSIQAGPTPPTSSRARWIEPFRENVLSQGAVSETKHAGFLSPLSYIPDQAEFGRLQQSETFWWFTGSVVYEDVLDMEHTHHFCWKYDFGIRTFEPFPRELNHTTHRKLQREALTTGAE